MSEKIKVHIADDHRIVIEGVTALLHTEDDIEVIAHSVTGREVVQWYTNKNEADVLVLDINMPEMDGIEVLRAFNQRGLDVKTIILSGLSDPKLVQEMITMGANAYIEKTSASEHIINAVRAVHRGTQYFSDEIKTSLFNLYIAESQNQFLDEELSDREIEVLIHIAKEKSSVEISKILNVSLKTVETHRRNLYRKLKVKNVVGLAMYAVRNNLV